MNRIVMAGLTLLIAGCSYLPAVGPDYRPLKLNLPDAYITPVGALTPATTPYWERLGDPTLNTLETQAIDQSLTLKQAWQRITQARAQSGMVLAGFGPQLAGNASLTGSRTGALANAVRPATETADTFAAGLGARWEIDLFGGNRRGLEAAEAGIAMREAQAAGVRSALTAEVARQYLTYRTLQARVALVAGQVSASRYVMARMEDQRAVGMVNGVAMARAAARHNMLTMQLPLLDGALASTRLTLEALLGQKPGALVSALSGTVPLPEVPASTTLILPSDLLTRRPDLMGAERAVAAATAQIGVATADLFPKFSLIGSYGVQAPTPGDLKTPDALVWRGGPQMSWALFATGQIIQNIRFTKARQREAVLAYQQAVLDALADVERSLTAWNAATDADALARTAQTQMKTAFDLSDTAHTEGQLNGLMWKTAETEALQAADGAVQARLQALNAYIALHQAMGL